MLNTPRLVMLIVLTMFATSDVMAAQSSVDTSTWVAQSDDEEASKKKAKEKVQLGRQLMKARSVPKSFPKSKRPRVGKSAEMKRTAEAAAAASRAAVKDEKSSKSSKSSESSSRSRSSSPRSDVDGGDIDYKERAKKGRFSFEFSKAEIMDIVKAISDMTRKNFIIPEKLKSQEITILSPTKITAAEAYQVFLSALSINGITVVKTGKFYKLIESKNAIKKPIPTCVGPDDVCPSFNEQMVTMLITMMHTEANQISSVLKSLVSKEGELTVFQPSNAIILSEYAPNIARIKRIIRALDQPGFDDELRIVQIEYATAQEVADKITQVFDVSGGGGATKSKSARKSPTSKAKSSSSDEASVQISKIIADERTNQIIIKANKRSFEAIRRLISRLDVPISEAEQGRIHVYYLENAKAEDLASTLSSLTQGSSTSKGRAGKKGKGASAPKSAQLFEGEIKITADKSTNSLIVVASAHDYRALKKLVERLDTVRPQVYIEAAILEVSNSNDNDIGVSWHTPVQFGANDLGGYGDGSLGFVQSGPWSAGSEGISSTVAGALSPTGLLGLAGGSMAGIVGKQLTIGDLTIPSFGMILKWLEVDSNAQVLSTPHILTTDNEEATIEVGKKVPFRRGTSLGSSALAGALGGAAGSSGLGSLGSSLGSLGGGMFSSVDRIDVSLKLSITPQINERNRIRLEVEQKIEDVTGIDKTTETPLTSNRSIKSVVVVEDQQTIVLGGLMRDNVTEGESKVPLLGDLPIIGWLFKTRTKKVEKVNLLLVLTPYIVRGVEDFQSILERKMEEHEEFTADYYGRQKQYRAHIDYRRKVGPLARLGRAVEREQSRIENGGDGGSDEVLVSPQDEGEESTAPETQFQTLSGEESTEGSDEAAPEVEAKEEEAKE
ncbi:MAG: type II secretion system secretin GspD [Deltaproteobacteria bacterium]|nr:type II secretion system secretin GspD [Deltaproteobacteria bacterium]MBT6432009.1 type II secretion system secretin GspD [Deltaproteobacteria bacterium]MBT6492087.1 type II secretion system secretin GspD [Deltaproteobacteria bacterium]